MSTKIPDALINDNIQNAEQEFVLFNDVCDIIDNVRGEIATYVNTQACLTKWYVGTRIKEDVLFNKRADYGKQVVKGLQKNSVQSMALDGQIGLCYIVYALRILLQKMRLCTQRVYN